MVTPRAQLFFAHYTATGGIVLVLREAEILQAIDRLRPHFDKPAPVDVILLCPVVLDVTVDRVMTWAEARKGGSRLDRTLARRVLPLSESELVRSFKDVWGCRQTAVNCADFQELKRLSAAELCLSNLASNSYYLQSWTGKRPIVVASYLRPSSGGRGGSRTEFRALILATTREAEAVLEAVVGPVVDFRIVAYSPEAEPRAVPSPSLSARSDKPAESPPGAVIIPLPQASPVPVPAPRPAVRVAAGADPPR